MDNISDNNAAPGISTVPTDITNDTGSGNQLDPLAGFTIGGKWREARIQC